MKTAGDDGEIIEGEFVEASGRRLRRLLPWLLAGLLAAFIGGLFAAPAIERSLQAFGLAARPEPSPPAPVAEAALAVLQARIATLEAALLRLDEAAAAAASERARADEILADLAAMPAGAGQGVAGPAFEALVDRVAALEALSAALPAAAGADEVARLVARLDAFGRRLAILEARERSGGTGVPAIAAHLIDLGARLDRGAPFADRLALLESELLALPPAQRAGLAESRMRLAALAASGAASRPVLAARFESLAFDLVRARPVPADEGFLASLGRRLGSVLVVRRTGEPAGEDAAAIVARAEAALGRGDLAGAVAELAALDPARRAVAEDWLADARRRLDAEAALATLVAGLTSSGQAAGGP